MAFPEPYVEISDCSNEARRCVVESNYCSKSSPIPEHRDGEEQLNHDGLQTTEQVYASQTDLQDAPTENPETEFCKEIAWCTLENVELAMQ